MTKSRTPLFALLPFAAACPNMVLAEPGRPVTAEEVLAASYARIHEAMGPIGGARRCPAREAGDDAIIVCARNDDSSMRLPLGSQPEEGARRRLVAGEPSSGREPLSVGRACCEHGGGINLLGVAGALARGADRILHPE
jgi:hypothetical protein